jgi:glucose/arabinose dehydrogenase
MNQSKIQCKINGYDRYFFAVILLMAAAAFPLPLFSQGVPQQFSERELQLLDSLQLPDGFEIDFYAKVPNARSIALGPGNTLFVGTRRGGTVYAVLNKDGDERAERVVPLARGLNSPNGVAYRNGDLYVAEIGRIIVFDDIMDNLRSGAPYRVVTEAYPDRAAHGWKFIAFGPDGMLYVPVGAPCNICLSEEKIFASITRIDVAEGVIGPEMGPDIEIYAEGIRNTVGFDWHPETGELWFTDNGRDWLGDNRPPDELNRVTAPGQHFGYPYIHGRDVVDPQFGSQLPGELDISLPARELGPHVAALGMRFYTGSQFPTAYKNQIFIAEHGSWNRTEKIGYRVSLVRLEGNRAVSYEPFAAGWLDTSRNSAWGRPVDVQVMPDGSLMVSDDTAGYLYRISYSR